jgi:hypothetical protein
LTLTEVPELRSFDKKYRQEIERKWDNKVNTAIMCLVEIT